MKIFVATRRASHWRESDTPFACSSIERLREKLTHYNYTDKEIQTPLEELSLGVSEIVLDMAGGGVMTISKLVVDA